MLILIGSKILTKFLQPSQLFEDFKLISEKFIKLLQQHPSNLVSCAFSVYREFFFEVCLNKGQMYFALCWDAFLGLTSNVHKVYKIYMLLQELNESLPYSLKCSLVPFRLNFE